MITLAGISLGIAGGNELVLLGLQANPLAVSSQRSEGGILHVLTAEMDGGRELELEGTILLSQQEAVVAIAALRNPVALVHPLFSGSVLITGTAFKSAETEYVNPEPTCWVSGSIYLLEM